MSRTLNYMIGYQASNPMVAGRYFDVLTNALASAMSEYADHSWKNLHLENSLSLKSHPLLLKLTLNETAKTVSERVSSSFTFKLILIYTFNIYYHKQAHQRNITLWRFWHALILLHNHVSCRCPGAI